MCPVVYPKLWNSQVSKNPLYLNHAVQDTGLIFNNKPNRTVSTGPIITLVSRANSDCFARIFWPKAASAGEWMSTR